MIVASEIIFYLFLLSFIVQAAIYLFLFPKLLLHNPSIIHTNKGVSVIVATHNEEENLKRLLPLLLSQNYSNFEIIVANDRSKDGSFDYLNSITSEKFKQIVISETPEGINSKKYALSCAIKEAKNEIILLTDADCYPVSEQWISLMAQSLTSEIVLGYSPYEKRNGFLNLFIRFETLLTAAQYLSFSLVGLAYMGVGRNLGYKKQLFQRNKGFEGFENSTGGDDDLLIGKASNGSNTSICIHNKAHIISIPKSDWKSFFRQKLRHLSIGKQYKWKQMLVASVLPFSQLAFYISFFLSIVSYTDISAILGIFIWRTLILIVIFVLITRKLGDRIKWYWIPVLDLCYSAYFISIGISTFFYKSVQWK